MASTTAAKYLDFELATRSREWADSWGTSPVIFAAVVAMAVLGGLCALGARLADGEGGGGTEQENAHRGSMLRREREDNPRRGERYLHPVSVTP